MCIISTLWIVKYTIYIQRPGCVITHIEVPQFESRYRRLVIIALTSPRISMLAKWSCHPKASSFVGGNPKVPPHASSPTPTPIQLSLILILTCVCCRMQTNTLIRNRKNVYSISHQVLLSCVQKF